MTDTAPTRAPDPRAAVALREAFARMMSEPTRAVSAAGIVSHSDSNEDVLWTAKALHGVAREGQVYYLSPDVTYVLGFAAQALAPEHLVHFNADDVPCERGFLVLDGQQYEIPTWGGEGKQYLRGVLWAVAVRPDGDAAGVCLWTVVSDENPRRPHDFDFASSHLRHSLFYKWGAPITIEPNDVQTFREETITRYKGLYKPDLPIEEEQRRSVLAVDAINRYFYTALHFMAEQIVLPERTVLGSRADRRRAEREKLPLPTLNVVRLRRVQRPRSDDTEVREVQWSHRWMVAGHWRNQPYGPRSDPKYRARWIRPYVKGPDDAPLVVTERVTSVIR